MGLFRDFGTSQDSKGAEAHVAEQAGCSKHSHIHACALALVNSRSTSMPTTQNASASVAKPWMWIAFGDLSECSYKAATGVA